jgi:two-component system chemotaxis response regulator CheB
MYRSLIHADYDEIVCVVLTGMGGDGTDGITQLSMKKKIYVIAQDQKTSVVYGMPKTIAQAGLVDLVEPLDRVADAITKNVGVH